MMIDSAKSSGEQIRCYDDADQVEEFLATLPENLTRFELAEKVAHWSWEMCLHRQQTAEQGRWGALREWLIREVIYGNLSVEQILEKMDELDNLPTGKEKA